MQAQAKQATASVLKRAATFAAIVDPANNASEAERATALDKLVKLCAEYGLNVADYVTQPAKPKADATGKREQAKAEQSAYQAHLATVREQARRYYAGASSPTHMRRAAARDVYASRVLTPVQRMRDGNPSERDCAGLAIILANVAADGVTFDPCAFALDVGIASRLASGGFITTDGATFKLTKTGRERAASTVKRAA